MRRLRLWRGYHAPDTAAHVRRAWHGEGMLVLCPPSLEDFSFLASLPPADVELVGDWEGHRPSLPDPRGEVAFPEEPLFGLFTTGTTREGPKLVLYSRRNVEASLDGILSFFEPSRIGTVFCYPQPSHTFGLCLGYLLCELRGLRLVSGIGKYSTAFHERRLAITDPRTLTLGTPTHFQDLLAYVESRGLALAPTYSAIIGGASVPRALWQRIRDALAIEAPSIGYGATEACPGVTHLPPGREPVDDGEIGVPLPHLDVRVGDDYLEARGSSVCLATLADGQWDFPEKLRLGDSVRERGDGILVFRGRSELVLNRGGEKFSLDQIEGHLRRELGVETVAVSVADARLGEELGLVACESPALPPRDCLYASLQAAFGRRFDEQRFLTVPALPLNASAKPDRKRCAAWLAHSVPVESLTALVPHRAPMVWIRRVLRADATGGECLVALDAGHARGAGGVRETSLLEWMAQSYAYVRAATCLRAGRSAGPARAFVAAVKDFTIAPGAGPRLAGLTGRECVTVEVCCVREMGPLALVTASVHAGDGACLARAALKLYAETSAPI